jgi:1,4-dihydroxy-6-naphthoate synthase
MKITLAHSPDSDDAFMFYAMEQGKLANSNYNYDLTLSDIQALNDAAINEQSYDISAISYHAYPYLDDHYELMSGGSSMGDNYGPTLIANQGADLEALLKDIKNGNATVVVPGVFTSAYLTLRLYAPNVQVQALPFNQIGEAIKSGRFKAGLIIHEGQITYEREGFCKLINLGEWWFERTAGLPLPLGANIIRRNLSPQVKTELSQILKQGIQYAFDNRDEALEYAATFGGDLKQDEADRFISMYVNELTLDLGTRGRKSVELFFREAYQLGLIPKMPRLEFV